ncbi:MAG: c-type cytochrome biogenesis protein CcmI [Burkholderiales bacterium]|nr:c-type cytochrome biogenesis protein CcmI [Anaerolineae bacterium]
MSTAGWFIALVLVAVVVLLITAPLLGRRSLVKRDDTLQRDQLVAVYERVLNNLRDLDEDFSTGKIQPEDYEQEREMWIQRGVQVLKALDAFAPEATEPTSVDDEIEARIAERRQQLHKENS